VAIRVIVPGKRFERPLWPFGVNRESSQANGLVGWWTPGINNHLNLLTQAPATPAAVSRVGSPLGLCGDFIPGSSSQIDVGVMSVLSKYSVAVIASSRLTGSTGEMIRYDAMIDGSRDIIILRHESGQVRWYNNLNGSETSLYGATGLADSIMRFYVATYDAGTATIYINGAQSATGSGTPGLASTTTGSWFIGCSQGSADFWDGSILDVRVYNRVLSAAEARAMYDPATRWDLYWVPRRRVFFDVGAVGGGNRRRRVLLAS
jgi:hypothetical protein